MMLSVLTVMFKAYDTDNTGYLSRDEVFKMIKASFTARGERVDDDEVMRAVDSTFEEIDTNRDNKLTFDEFKSAVYANKLLINCSVHFPSSTVQPQSAK